MISSRIVAGVFAALSSLTVSVDPGVLGGGRAGAGARHDRPLPAALDAPLPTERAGEPVVPLREEGPMPVSAALRAEGPAPQDLKVEITRDGRGHRVVVRRPGHLVALSYGAARAAGKDWAAVHVEVRGGDPPRAGAADHAKKSDALPPLVWEATPFSTLTTERGIVALSLTGDDVRAEASRAALPESAGTSSGPHHTCAAHRDPSGGFTVLCRIHHGARHIAVANVTGPRALDQAWVIPEKDPLVRLDLPLAVGMAEARVIGFVHGVTGAVLRAEASWVEGESPSLVIEETERAQPVASEMNWR